VSNDALKGDAPAGAKVFPKKKRVTVYVPIPALDNTLTFVFLAECLAVMYMYSTQLSDMRTLFIALGVTAAVAGVVGELFKLLGSFVSRRLKKHPLEKPKALRKFTAQSWQLAIHVFFALWESYVIRTEMGGLGNNMMVNDESDPVSPMMKALYISQLAVWIYTCMVHRWFDERRKDYFVMYVHHVATIALVAGSAQIGYYRAGLVVLFTHDASDIAIDILKMANYMALEGAEGFFLSEIAFVGNLVSWTYYRLYVFPKEVIWASTLGESERFIRNIDHDAPFIDRFPGLYLMCIALLGLLLCLHIYWYLLLLRILWKIIKANNAHDAGREEYEGDSDETSSDPEASRRRYEQNQFWAAAFIGGLALVGIIVASVGPKEAA